MKRLIFFGIRKKGEVEQGVHLNMTFFIFLIVALVLAAILLRLSGTMGNSLYSAFKGMLRGIG